MRYNLNENTIRIQELRSHKIIVAIQSFYAIVKTFGIKFENMKKKGSRLAIKKSLKQSFSHLSSLKIRFLAQS